MFIERLQKYIFAIILCSYSIAFAQYSAFAEQISGGKVSESLEQDIKRLLLKIGFADDIKIRKSSPALVIHNSEFTRGGYYKKYNYLYIKEDFFSGLVENEKIFWLADNINFNKYATKFSIIQSKKNMLYFFMLSQALLASIIFHKNIIKYFLATTLGVGMLNYISKDYEKLKDAKFFSDKEIVKEFNCLEGARSLLSKTLSTDYDYLNKEQRESVRERLARLISLRL